MPNFGIGVGSFLNGVIDGASIAQQWKRQKQEDDLAERQMKLRETAAQRDLENDAQERQWRSEDRARDQRERDAQQPLIDAQRAGQLQSLQTENNLTKSVLDIGRQTATDYGKAKTAARGLIAESRGVRGASAISYGSRYYDTKEQAEKAADDHVGTMTDFYLKNGVPKVQEAYIRAGQPEKAQAYGKWVQDTRVQAGMKDAAHLAQAFNLGDWGAVNKHLDSILANNGYMDTSSYDGDASPIKDKDGKTTGMRIKFKNKDTGAEFSQDFTDLEEFQSGVLGIVNPEAVFEHNTAKLQALTDAKAKAFEQTSKLADNITLENAKSANRVAEDEAKAVREDPKSRQKRLLDRIAALEASDLNFSQLSPDEKVARAQAELDAIDQATSAKADLGAPEAPRIKSLPPLASGATLPVPTGEGTVAATPGMKAQAQAERTLSLPPNRSINVLRRPVQ